ncbi:hypothetical protein C5S31_09665 [ANME-1 cluster archaeon GoMg2]|nr:hypothetical protein [ANME-1 cluster archaeon GoMg2]
MIITASRCMPIMVRRQGMPRPIGMCAGKVKGMQSPAMATGASG